MVSPKRTQRTYTSLRAWRDAHSMTLREAARVLGVSQSGYCKWEYGHRHPGNSDRLKAVAKKTGISIAVLMGVAA